MMRGNLPGSSAARARQANAAKSRGRKTEGGVGRVEAAGRVECWGDK